MEWLTENWFWVLIGIVFVGMHLFGHGGHGGGGHGGNTSKGQSGTAAGRPNKHAGHRH